MAATKNFKDRRSSKRKPARENVRFTIELDPAEATTLDISEGGIKFESRSPVTVRMKLRQNGSELERKGRLVWSGPVKRGGSAFGLEFEIDDLPRLYGEARP